MFLLDAIPGSDLAEHVTTLVKIIGALFGLLVALVAWAWKSQRDDLHENREETKNLGSSITASMNGFASAQSSRWDKHEEDHREFRKTMLSHETRLSRLEGQHVPRARRVEGSRTDEISD